ncbi:hypothetical protein B0J14DRAFT_594777 [Halenospora varia]|nr:hypothetical protein B0J14DRAFT_594777 [Halenospora varia]
MANSQADGKKKVRRRAHSEWEDEKPDKSRGKERVTPHLEEFEPRRRRVERVERSLSPRRSAATPTMASESYATLPSQKSSSGHRRRRDHHRSPEERSHRRRRKSSSREESPSTTYVYESSPSKSHKSRITLSEVKRLESEYDSSDFDDTTAVESSGTKERPTKRKIKIVYITEEDYNTKHKERTPKKEKRSRDSPRRDDSPKRSRAHRSRRKSATEAPPSSPPRRASTREPRSEAPPSLRRSNTTSQIPSAKPYAPSLTTTATTTKRSSFLGSFFGPPAPQNREPERLVECLTCLSDDIPRSKSAKLKCGHRMCHSCLRRIFKLSVTDPQHMPPKCCTADHIPLKHVERLFDINFKKNWNRKFQEYSTKNRIYCPARRCGEWIQPGNIHKEDGKKYGKCGRCKTKVCVACNGKWHGAKDCPKDDETNRLLETAKQEGWQRCYNCRTMVELKEGCNHMTCRCTAEFCMICGLKWKSCNCPWFNYDAVEADRLNHMQIPEPIDVREIPLAPGRLQRPRRPRPNTYHEEMNERRRQERLDEEMARRLQTVSIDDDDDYQGGIGDIHGIGNGAGHHLNQDYIRAAHNILTGRFDDATAAANYVMGVAQARGGPPPPPPGPRRMAGRFPFPTPQPPPPPPLARPVTPPPLLRRHTTREHAYNTSPSTRPEERVVPRRIRTDYASEAAVHAPLPRAPEVPTTPKVRSPPRVPRVSVLAGLGSGRGHNRVNAWRTHVEPGQPEEGVLSM